MMMSSNTTTTNDDDEAHLLRFTILVEQDVVMVSRRTMPHMAFGFIEWNRFCDQLDAALEPLRRLHEHRPPCHFQESTVAHAKEEALQALQRVCERQLQHTPGLQPFTFYCPFHCRLVEHWHIQGAMDRRQMVVVENHNTHEETISTAATAFNDSSSCDCRQVASTAQPTTATTHIPIVEAVPLPPSNDSSESHNQHYQAHPNGSTNSTSHAPSLTITICERLTSQTTTQKHTDLSNGHDMPAAISAASNNTTDRTTDITSMKQQRTTLTSNDHQHNHNINNNNNYYYNNHTPGTLGVDYLEHTVLPTDTLPGICLHYSISAARLKRANHVLLSANTTGDTHLLALAQTLVVPLDSNGTGVNTSLPTMDVESDEYKLHALRTKFSNLTKKEAKAYLELADGSLNRAVLAAKEDMDWELSQQQQQKRQS